MGRDGGDQQRKTVRKRVCLRVRKRRKKFWGGIRTKEREKKK